ncbi:ABC transporter ATP-binding protein [Phytoactinopolyspora mesophila]|uniref:ATP-binding cassette domain-containing protein n=1 Tax=Phytoactinopolyspora mesophila TaxID=2650750 RepID=A0A7K3M6A1_9ACTN|nr:ABC transporter ATP-binding protein [Phytoactinopolyspora mesophila]NDL58557.1 ATP-binding cassette domain-containing protein [Phytoactinopolyspora mesophila]
MDNAENAGDAPAEAAGETAIELTGITKRFPGVIANRDVHLQVNRGEVHAVVGENGAGKSTLMKILYGMYRPDEGVIAVDGKPVDFHGPKDAIAAGIGMVHQHFMLADNFTVLENIVLGAEPRRGIRLDFAAARRQIIELSERYGLGLRPGRLVEELSVAARQRVEIAKVLFRGARVLILDEPTAVLVPQEVDALFSNLGQLREAGLSVIFISHKLDEVRQVADRVTVIRRGETVATVDPRATSSRELAHLMVGSELPTPETTESTVTEQVELSVRGVTIGADDGPDLLQDISFDVRRGEIVGFAGVEGNGQSELVEAIMGLRPLDAGSIEIGSQDVTSWSSHRRRVSGVGFIPEDRHRQALLLEAPLWENRLLGWHSQAPAGGRFWINPAIARAETVKIMKEYDVRAPGPETLATALSGGNQQKFVIGREMSTDLRVLVAAHPTRGIDVGAQAAVWDRLREARAAGLATVLLSADLEELLGLSDTLYVLFSGRIVAKLDPAAVTPEILGAHMTGAAAGPDEAGEPT